MSSNESRATSADSAEENGSPQASSSKLDSSTNPDKRNTEQDGLNSEGNHDDSEQKDSEKATDNNEDKHENDEMDSTKTKEGENTDNANAKATGASTMTPGSAAATVAAAGEWQAIWAPVQGAYYFYNSRTGETTWVNPLQAQQASTGGPGPSSMTTTAGATTSLTTGEVAGTSASASTATLYAAAEAAGIDPSLAYLDPSLGLPGGSSSTPAGTFTAKFNARTGAFTRPDARDPSHLSEVERAKRMSEVYFDVGAWEQELEQRYAEEEAAGKKRKRPSKKDLERFKEQKRLKKIAKTAWLRT